MNWEFIETYEVGLIANYEIYYCFDTSPYLQYSK